MKPPEAMAYMGQVAPYQLIPDYVHGMVLPDWITILYVRLSKGDKDKEKEDDSDSIVNQKKMLGKYAMDNHLPNPVFFTDDDITGTTFERRAFKAAMAFVEEGRVKNFVVKDMSRFGRDYIRVGLYMEIFHDMDVRLVAVYDNVDSDRGIDDLTPFRNIMNEIYARDCSKKIRAVFRTKGLMGEHTTTNIPYGYKRDPKNPKHWVIDEEAAETVRQIYRWCLGGFGLTHIAQMLQDMKVDTPTHRLLKLGVNPANKPQEIPWDWNLYAVRIILARPEYLGHTVNFRTYRKSYKNKKTVKNDPSNYAVFENTHDPIIDRDTFDHVQELRAKGKRRRASSGRVGLLSGLAYCADCKSKMHLSSGESQTPGQDFYACSSFRSKKRACNHSHYIRLVVLESAVLEQIQRVTAFAAQHEQAFAELLRQDGADKSRKELAADKRKLAQAQSRIAELDTIIQRLYEDSVSGKLTDERFMKLSKGYEAEQKDLQMQTEALARQIAEQEQQTLDLSRFLNQVRKYIHVEELTPIMLNELVQRVEVHMPDKSSGKRVQQIDIYFKSVGLIDELELAITGKPEPVSHANAGKQPGKRPQSGEILTVLQATSALS